MMRRRKPHLAGFTLIEVLVAGGLTAIGLAAIFHLTSTLLLAARGSTQVVKAALRADQELTETVISLAKDDSSFLNQPSPSFFVLKNSEGKERLRELHSHAVWGNNGNRIFSLTTRKAKRIIREDGGQGEHTNIDHQ